MRRWHHPRRKTCLILSNQFSLMKVIFVFRVLLESSPPIPTNPKQNITDSSRQKFLSMKTNESFMNSPQMNKIISNVMTSNNAVTTGNNEKSFVGYQSDRFEQTQTNKSYDTMRKLENVLKEKKLGAMIYEKLKTESNSTKNSNLRQMMQNTKSNKSQSFYQTKFLIPQPIHLLKNTGNNSNSSFTRQNSKSFHKKNPSQCMKEQKISNDSPKKKVVEKNENTNRNSKSKSIDNSNNNNNINNSKNDGAKKVLNVTLMGLKRPNKSFTRNIDDKREKSISIERIKENIDKILNLDKMPKTNKSVNNEKNISYENSPAFFSNESTNKKNNFTNASQIQSSENNRKSYYQLAYLLKDKNFISKYNSNNNNNNNNKDDRVRFKSMYDTVKTEVSNQKQRPNNESIQNISNVFIILEIGLLIFK